MLAAIPDLTASLHGLEDRFRARNAPVARLLRPGLSDDQIDTLTAELPFRFSDELRCLYRWHDGADEYDDAGEQAHVPGMGVIAPLSRAVEEYHRWADAAQNPYQPYSPTWFPINVGRDIIVVESSVPPGIAGPLHLLDSHGAWERDRAPSLLHAVRSWTQMLDDGHWAYNQSERGWETRPPHEPGAASGGLTGDRHPRTRADVAALTSALHGLEDRFRARNAPVARLLRPGLSDGQIDTLTAELPFRFSDELRCLYRWHDGANETDDETGECAFVPGMDVIAPLSHAIREYHRWVEAPSMPQEPYSPTWFPINLGRTIIVVESGVAAGMAGSLHSLDTHSEWLYDRAPSLLHAVRLWNTMMDDGYWIYDEFEHDWEDHYLDIPEELRATGLV